MAYTMRMANGRRERATAPECCSDGEWHYPRLEEAAQIFKALGDEARLSILMRLREQGEVCACNLGCCDLAQPTISHHLKVLREAGLVVGEKRGLWVYYRLNHEKMALLRTLLP